MPYPFDDAQGTTLLDMLGGVQPRRRGLLQQEGLSGQPSPFQQQGMAARTVPLPQNGMAAREVPAPPVQPPPPLPAVAPSGLASAAAPLPPPQQGEPPIPNEADLMRRLQAAPNRPLTPEEEKMAGLPPRGPNEKVDPNEAAAVRAMLSAPNLQGVPTTPATPATPAPGGPMPGTPAPAAPGQVPLPAGIPGLPPGYTPRSATDYLKEWREFKAARGPAPMPGYTVAGYPGAMERAQEAWNKDTWDAFMAFKALEAQRLSPMLKMEELKSRERVAEIGERTKQKALEYTKGPQAMLERLATAHPEMTPQQQKAVLDNYTLMQGLLGKQTGAGAAAAAPAAGATAKAGANLPPMPGGAPAAAVPPTGLTAEEALQRALGEPGAKIITALKPQFVPASKTSEARTIPQAIDPVQALVNLREQAGLSPEYIKANMRHIVPYLESIYGPEKFKGALTPGLGARILMGWGNLLTPGPGYFSRRTDPFSENLPLPEQFGTQSPYDLMARQLRSYYPPGMLPWERR